MFDNVSVDALRHQMKSQQATVVETIQEGLQPNVTRHVALLPAEVGIDESSLGFPVVTWQAIRDSFEGEFGASYFTSVLSVALDGWKSFVGSSWGPGTPFDDEKSGLLIRESADAGTLEHGFMGRMGGLDGSQLADDIRSGAWEKQRYRLRKEPAESSNWFPVAAFIQLLKASQPGS